MDDSDEEELPLLKTSCPDGQLSKDEDEPSVFSSGTGDQTPAAPAARTPDWLDVSDGAYDCSDAS